MKHLLMALATLLLSQSSFCVLAQSQLNIVARQNSSTLPPNPTIQAQGLQGIWQGTLEAGGTKLRLILKVAKSTNDTFTATLDIPDQGGKDVPVDAVTVKDATVRLELKSLGAVYEGVINKERTAITGHWNQAAMTLPLTLNRVDKAPAASLRPQEPKKPYPYDEEE